MTEQTSPDHPLQSATSNERTWLSGVWLHHGHRFLARFVSAYRRLANLPRKLRRRIQRVFATGLVGAALLLAWGPTPNVHAATITVDAAGASTGIAADGYCSLVEAIINANNDAATHPDCDAGSGDDFITLSGGAYSYSTAYGTNSALPNITSNITINANGATIERNPGAANFRLTRVDEAGTLTLNNGIITGGRGYGGIHNRGTLTLNDSIVTGNFADSVDGAGISNRAAAGNATTTINNSTIANNDVYDGMGGGIANYSLGAGDATVTINNSTISRNTVYGYGGGISNNRTSSGAAQVTINNSTVSRNYSYYAFFLSSGYGGGIYNGPNNSAITLSGSLVTGNEAYYGGNEIDDRSGNTIAGNYNLFGHSLESNGDAFSNFTPSGSDINATSSDANLDLNTIVEKGLRDRGTLSHSLVSGSVAIDAIPTSAAICTAGVSSDQHGGVRANGAGAGGSGCDIGAMEYDSRVGTDIVVTPGAAGLQNGDGCSLAEAIINANNDDDTYSECVPGLGVETITLAGNTYSYNAAVDAANATALPTINSVLTIDANGATIERNTGVAGNFRILNVKSNGDFTLNQATIQGGSRPTNNGGGIQVYHAKLTLTASVISGNSSGLNGGGLYVFGTMRGDISALAPEWGSDAELTLRDTTIANNEAGKNGGGAMIWGAPITIENVTIANNDVVGSGLRGGGLAVAGVTGHISNSTISGNSVRGGSVNSMGGGFANYVDLNGLIAKTNDLTLNHVTITDNEANRTGGGVGLTAGTFEIKNSLISGNTADTEDAEMHVETDYAQYYQPDRVQAYLVSSVVGDNRYTSAEAGVIDADVTRTDAILATSDGDTPTLLADILNTTLANNGGPTLTHALVNGSPAIDVAAPDAVRASTRTISADMCNGLSTDQRGAVRPVDGGSGNVYCDAGSFEYASPTAVTLVSFEAVAEPDGVVRLQWETAVEVDNAGFNVYRSATPHFEPETALKINTELIAAQAQLGAGAEYEFVDQNVGGGIWYYFLEDFDLGGIATLHGPAAVEIEAPTSVGASSLQTHAWHTAPVSLLLSVVAFFLIGIAKLRRNE